MFYCEECRIKAKWPDSLCQSVGPCECCGHSALCWDRPSRSLPIPQWPEEIAEKEKS